MNHPDGVNLDSKRHGTFLWFGRAICRGTEPDTEKGSALYAGHDMDHAQVSLHQLLDNMALRMTKGPKKNVLQLKHPMHSEVENRFHRAGMECLPSIICYPQSEADLRVFLWRELLLSPKMLYFAIGYDEACPCPRD